MTEKKSVPSPTKEELLAIYTALKKPLPPEAVTPHPTKAYLSVIKAIYVVERFNDAFGLGGWNIRNEIVSVGSDSMFGSPLPASSKPPMVVVKSTFTAPRYGITVSDIFGGNDNADLGDAYKGACTDALTKIGSYLGVGMDVYKGLGDKKKPAAPSIPIPTKPAAKPDKPEEKTGGFADCDVVGCENKANLRFGRECFPCSQRKKAGERLPLKSEGAVPDTERKDDGMVKVEDIPF